MECAAACTATDIQLTFDTFRSCVVRLELRSMSATKSRCLRQALRAEPFSGSFSRRGEGKQNPRRSPGRCWRSFDRNPRSCRGAVARVIASHVRRGADSTCATAMQCSLTLTVGYRLVPVAWSPTGLEGRSKSRMKGGLGAGPHLVSTSTSMRIRRRDLCNAASMWIGNAATPLAICRDVGHATHGTHGV